MYELDMWGEDGVFDPISTISGNDLYNFLKLCFIMRISFPLMKRSGLSASVKTCRKN